MSESWTTFATKALLIILELGRGRGPLLTQGSRPTWLETSRMPQYFARSPNRLYFTQTPRCSHTPSSLAGRGGTLYRLLLAPLTWTMCSQRLPPSTPPHQRPLRSVKKFKLWTTNGRSIHDNQNNHQPWQCSYANEKLWREWWILIICRVAQKLAHNIGQHTGTWVFHPRTPTDAKGHIIRGWCYLLKKKSSSPRPKISILRRLLTPIPPWPKTT